MLLLRRISFDEHGDDWTAEIWIHGALVGDARIIDGRIELKHAGRAIPALSRSWLDACADLLRFLARRMDHHPWTSTARALAAAGDIVVT